MERGSGERPVGTDLRDVVSGQHICLMFGDDDERFDLLARFFAAARTGGHELLFVTDTLGVVGTRERFAAAGFDFPHPPAGVINSTDEAFFPAGRFDPEEMLDFLEDQAKGSLEEGFAGFRAAGEMTWALRGIPGSERLVEYELMLTEVIERTPMAGICQYDVRRFDGPTLLAILEVHPFMIVRGQVLRNPNFRRLADVLPPGVDAR